jgi:hypothetical protein
MFIFAFLRSRHSRHDFADRWKEQPKYQYSVMTVGQESKHIFGRPFVTAGWIVLGVTGVVAVVEVGLLVLILRL